MMFWSDLKFPSPFWIAIFMEQLMSLCVELGDKDSTARYLASLKSKLADDKASRKEAQVEVKALARAVGDLKKMVEKFASQVPELEEKVLGKLTKLCAKQLSLE
jgi:hypothetical protein